MSWYISAWMSPWNVLICRKNQLLCSLHSFDYRVIPKTNRFRCISFDSSFNNLILFIEKRLFVNGREMKFPFSYPLQWNVKHQNGFMICIWLCSINPAILRSSFPLPSLPFSLLFVVWFLLPAPSTAKNSTNELLSMCSWAHQTQIELTIPSQQRDFNTTHATHIDNNAIWNWKRSYQCQAQIIYRAEYLEWTIINFECKIKIKIIHRLDYISLEWIIESYTIPAINAEQILISISFSLPFQAKKYSIISSSSNSHRSWFYRPHP